MSEMTTPITPCDVSNATLHFGNAILVTFETASTIPSPGSVMSEAFTCRKMPKPVMNTPSMV